MKSYKKKILFVLFVILVPLIVACEGQGEGGRDITDLTTTYDVTFEVNTRAASGDATTDATQAERIHTLLLFVVNRANDKIEAVIDRTFDEEDRLTYKEVVTLTAGAKTIYGFANLTPDMRDQAGLNGEVEDPFPTDIIQNTATCRTDERKENYIPMSNAQEIVVNKLPGQGYSIELVRLMCKVTVKVTNEAGYPITLQSLEMTPFPALNAPVYLLPHQQNGISQLPEGTTLQTLWWSWPEGEQALPDVGSHRTYAMYINESAVPNDGWFTFQLNTIKNGIPNEDRFSISSVQVLNRNDHLPVNITLTDYKLRLDVQSYPPIGGYPSVEVPMKDKEYYAHFPGGGPFVITPKLSKYSTGEEVTEGVVWSMSIDPLTDLDLFDVKPVMKNNEVTGTLKHAPQTGKKALCTLTATVESATATSRILTYKVYIMTDGE